MCVVNVPGASQKKLEPMPEANIPFALIAVIMYLDILSSWFGLVNILSSLSTSTVTSLLSQFGAPARFTTTMSLFMYSFPEVSYLHSNIILYIDYSSLLKFSKLAGVVSTIRGISTIAHRRRLLEFLCRQHGTFYISRSLCSSLFGRASRFCQSGSKWCKLGAVFC